MVNYSDQTLAENYYTRSRHNNISCINISQTYHILPRKKNNTIQFNKYKFV